MKRSETICNKCGERSKTLMRGHLCRVCETGFMVPYNARIAEGKSEHNNSHNNTGADDKPQSAGDEFCKELSEKSLEWDIDIDDKRLRIMYGDRDQYEF